MSTLAERAQGWVELEPGQEYPVEGNFCVDCKSTDLVFVVKLEAVPGALAGMQLKTAARSWPYLRCRGCGRESKGRK